ncbi:MAG: hypothetical protein SFV81_16965 [Pirellulaceae bacterium]|nr:hypothetical protein [Pirellulaceae bacterium]
MKQTRKIQYGISAILILMACVAGYLSGYRFGTDERIAKNQTQQVSVRSYNVADLLSGSQAAVEADLAELQRLILATTGSDLWTESAEIQPYSAAKSMVIMQTGAGHDKVQKLLGDLRSHRNRSAK